MICKTCWHFSICRSSSLTWSHFFYYEYQLTPHSSPSLDFGGRGCAPPSGLPSSMTMSLPPSLLLPVPPSSSRSCDSLAQVVDRITLTLNRGWSTDLQGFSHITPLFYIFCNLCPHCGLHDYLLEATFQKGIAVKTKEMIVMMMKKMIMLVKGKHLPLKALRLNPSTSFQQVGCFSIKSINVHCC